MFRHSAKVMAPPLPGSSRHITLDDSEEEIMFELDQKRRQIDDEIKKFRAQKEKEFRNFENELRTSRKRKMNDSSNQQSDRQVNGNNTKPKRSSSSSALDLLVGHGVTKPRPTNSSPSKKTNPKSIANGDSSSTVTLPCKPTLSLDPLNIKGSIPQSQTQVTPAPTRLNQNLNGSSSSSSTSTSSPQNQPPPTPPIGQSSQGVNKDTFTGLFVPSYLPLLDAKSRTKDPSSTSPVSVPDNYTEHVISQQSIGSIVMPEGITPLQSSSFPPSIVIMSPTNPANKRSYTAPTVSATRIPSALRTGSGENLGRKRKRVTFRLADSAIVEPSSSYEEGLSPQIEGSESPESERIPRSPLRNSNQSSRSSSRGSKKTSDEEDEEAGVVPGMDMGTVMQKLNQYNLSSADEDIPNVEYNDDEDVGHFDVKYHEDDEEDEPMALVFGVKNDEVGEDDDEDEAEADNSDLEEDGYFSPKAKHAISPMEPSLPDMQVTPPMEQRRGSSPISPYRDENWDHLSSSDKDRLLFSRRSSDEEERLKNGQRPQDRFGSARSPSQNHVNEKNPFDKSTVEHESINGSTFNHAIDGGSGVGFFELDEELASPDAGVARPFDLEPIESGDTDVSNVSEIPADSDSDFLSMNAANTSNLNISKAEQSERHGLGISSKWTPQSTSGGLKRTSSEKRISSMNGAFKSSYSDKSETMPVGSVPINIVRPSPHVSSSWVGTFGH